MYSAQNMFNAEFLIFLVFCSTLVTSEDVLRVLIPLEVTPEMKNFWKIDPTTNKPKGFFIDLIQELFKSMNLSYSLEYNTPNNFKNYTELSE